MKFKIRWTNLTASWKWQRKELLILKTGQQKLSRLKNRKKKRLKKNERNLQNFQDNIERSEEITQAAEDRKTWSQEHGSQSHMGTMTRRSAMGSVERKCHIQGILIRRKHRVLVISWIKPYKRKRNLKTDYGVMRPWEPWIQMRNYDYVLTK